MNNEQKRELEQLITRLKKVTYDDSISFSKLITLGKDYNGPIYDDNKKDKDGHFPLIYKYEITPKGGKIISYYNDIYKDKIADDIQIRSYRGTQFVKVTSTKENISLMILIRVINENKPIGKLLFYLGKHISYVLDIIVVIIWTLIFVAIYKIIT